MEQKTARTSLESIISINMKVALAVRNKSQADLARGLGVSNGVISQKMRGRTAWTIPDMEKAGEFLGIQPARFLEANGFLVAGSGFEPETSGL